MNIRKLPGNKAFNKYPLMPNNNQVITKLFL